MLQNKPSLFTSHTPNSTPSPMQCVEFKTVHERSQEVILNIKNGPKFKSLSELCRIAPNVSYPNTPRLNMVEPQPKVDKPIWLYLITPTWKGVTKGLSIIIIVMITKQATQEM